MLRSGYSPCWYKWVTFCREQNLMTKMKSLAFCRKFVFFTVPQIQYRNPWVQIMMFKNMTPSPFLRFYLGKDFFFCLV